MLEQVAIATDLRDPSARHAVEWKLHWVLRLALFCEFVGHGAFGILMKAGWVPYFQTFGIPEAWAWRLMPVVGSVDILLGVLALVAPIRAALLYMAVGDSLPRSSAPSQGKGGGSFWNDRITLACPSSCCGYTALGPRSRPGGP